MTETGNGLRILLIEDNAGDRYLLEDLLKNSVIKIDIISHAISLQSAIDYLVNDSFEIIILDLILPDSSGVDTFKTIRKHSGNIPIIILSGLSDMSVAMEAISLGAQDYLLKDELEERLLTKSILYSIERNRTNTDLVASNDQYLMLRKSELDAIKSQELASQIIDAALDAIVCADKFGKVIAWNPQAVNLFGWTQSEVLGKSLAELIIPEKNKEYYELGVKNYLQSEKAPFLNNLNEITAVDKSGNNINVEFFFIRIEEEGSAFFCAFIRDIGFRKRSQQKTDYRIKQKLYLGDLHKGLSRVQDFEGIFNITMKAIQQIFQVDKASFLIQNEDNSIEYKGLRNVSDKFMNSFVACNPWTIGVNDLQPIFVHLDSKETSFEELLPQMNAEGISTLVYIPFVYQQNILGRLVVCFSNARDFSEDEIELLENIAGYVSFSIADNKTANDLKRSEVKYRTLIEQASDAIIIYTMGGEIIDYNNAFMFATGYTKKDVNNLHLTDLLFKEDLKSRPILFDKVIAGSPVHDIRHIRRKDKSSMHAELTSKIMPDGNVMVIARDITERKKAENALKESESKYRTLVEQAVDAIILFNVNGNLLDANSGAANLLGYEKHELIGMTIVDILTPEEFQMNPFRFDELKEGNSTITQRKLKRKDGTLIDTEFRKQRLPDGEILSVIRDLSERVKSEKKLEESYEAIRQLTSHIQNVREEERTNIAREIHDELGQKLTVLKMDASWIKNKIINENENVKSRMNDFIIMLDETVGTVRKMSLELRPSLLDDLGLVPAMEWQIGEFKKSSEFITNFIHDIDETELSNTIRTSFFRIFQESMTNVSRHSLAKEVVVVLKKKENNLIMSIVDNGVGFDKQDIVIYKNMGILGMEERMRMIGGKYSINSHMGKGTEVIVQLELN